MRIGFLLMMMRLMLLMPFMMMMIYRLHQAVASGDLALLPRNHLKRPNQGQNASLSDIYETVTNTGKDSNSTGTMNKKQRRST